MEPSSPSTISKVSPLASITDLSRAYKSVTFSCSLWSGTTIEYLSTVFFIIRQRGGGFAVACVGRGLVGGNRMRPRLENREALGTRPCSARLSGKKSKSAHRPVDSVNRNVRQKHD